MTEVTQNARGVYKHVAFHALTIGHELIITCNMSENAQSLGRKYK